MQRAVERGGRAGQRGERIAVRAADAAHGGGGAILLVVGVQDEEHVERALQRRVGLVAQLRTLEHHAQEIARIAELAIGVDERHADRVAVAEGGDGRHFGRHALELHQPVLGVEDVLALFVERGKRGHGGEEHAHRVGVVPEPVDELLGLLVDQRVRHHDVHELVELAAGREFAEVEQVGHLEKAALLGQLLDRIAAVAQDALVAVDEGDAALAGRGVHEARIVGHQAEVLRAGFDFLQIRGADGPVFDGDLIGLTSAVINDGQRVRRHKGTMQPG